MIELKRDALHFSFTDVHPEAKLRIEFQRTLRIPDDGRDYALPPGLGRFPVRHVDDVAARLPEEWLRRGGVMLPMYRSEAMWLNLHASGGEWSLSASGRRRGRRSSGSAGSGFGYPFAVKVAAGKINAVTGEDWEDGLHRDPQDYLVVPQQPWLDGYVVKKGVIRQFVAMPLGAGYSAEEQLKGIAESGGVQLIAYPMRREVWERIRVERVARTEALMLAEPHVACALAPDMGLAPGGRMRQEIYDDPFEFDVWDTRHSSRCFVHLTDALVWRALTGEGPPTTPPTAEEYTRRGLPWFDFYGNGKAVDGSKVLGGLDSVAELGKKKGDMPLPENASVDPTNVIALREGLKTGQVREGGF